MNHKKNRQSQGKQRSPEQQPRARKEKQLPLENLASVSRGGGFIRPVLDTNNSKTEDDLLRLKAEGD